MESNKLLTLFILPFLFLLGFAVRLYGFNNPVADWHSWRQADTSSVSRNFVTQGFDLLHPTYHDLSNVPSARDNLMGYRFVEFPIYNALQAGGFLIFDIFTLEQWGRLITIFVSLLAGWFLYRLVKKYSDTTAAIFALFFYLFLPFSIYYSRTILPDQSMVMAVLGAIYFFDKWLEGNSKFKDQKSKAKFKIQNLIYYSLALFFSAVALLLKPFAAFFLLPIVYLSWNQFGWGIFRKWQLYVFAILCILPLAFWRVWMMQYPEGIPASNWLFNGGNIRFKGAYFFWIFGDRIGRLILGFWGIGLFVVGLLINSNKAHLKKHGIFFYTFLLSSLLYLVIVARGNVQHDYYQIPIIPSLAIFLGLGSRFIFFPPKEYVSPLISRVVLGVCIGFTLMFGWYFVRDYYNINNPIIVEAGRVVAEKTPKNAKVIALYDGDTSFLYQTERSGWTSYQDPLPVLIEKGAEYLVQVNPTEQDIKSFTEQYEIVVSTPTYILVKLK